MSDDAGHCRHCSIACPAVKTRIPSHRNADDTARWETGHCPACAEAELIAKAIEGTAVNYPAQFTSTHALIGLLAKIARGRA